MMSLEERAYTFAEKAHRGQLRRYTGAPYFEHVEAVASVVATVPHTPEMLAAAFLHDVVEDCDVSIDDIFRDFGFDVARYVSDLTSPPASAGNRAQRKQMDLRRLATAHPKSKTIKLADLIDNTSTIVERDPGFARVYMPEKAALLPVLADGDPTLFARAKAMVDSYLSTATEISTPSLDA